MRNLLLCSLGLLFACAGPASNQNSGTRTGGSSNSGSSSFNNSSASSMDTPDVAVLGSQAERAAIERHEEMLSDLAKRGIHPETKPTQVTVKYHRAGTIIGLYNDANVSQKDYYTTARTSANYKVIPDIEMGALLKALDDLGYYDEAADGITRVAGASLSVVVRQGGAEEKSYTLSWGASMGKKNNELTQTCADAVRVIFDTTRSVQVVDNPEGTDFFQHERERIQRENVSNATKH